MSPPERATGLMIAGPGIRTIPEQQFKKRQKSTRNVIKKAIPTRGRKTKAKKKQNKSNNKAIENVKRKQKNTFRAALARCFFFAFWGSLLDCFFFCFFPRKMQLLEVRRAHRKKHRKMHLGTWGRGPGQMPF